MKTKMQKITIRFNEKASTADISFGNGRSANLKLEMAGILKLADTYQEQGYIVNVIKVKSA